jgi:hypothetical protein
VDIAVLTKLFHGDADTGFGKIHLIDDINGTYLSISFKENQYSFKIIFSRFMKFHVLPPVSIGSGSSSGFSHFTRVRQKPTAYCGRRRIVLFRLCRRQALQNCM